MLTFQKIQYIGAFIIFCKNKELGLSDDIREVCGIDFGDSYSEMTMEEKIAKLQDDGINYDENLMQKLLTIVNLKNSLTINFTFQQPNSIQLLTESLNHIKLLNSNSRNHIIPPQFVTYFPYYFRSLFS